MTMVTSGPASGRTNPHQPTGVAWQQALRTAIRDPRELCQLLDLPAEAQSAAAQAAETFPLFAPRGYVARMRKGDPHDPLLRQVLPVAAELDTDDGYTPDPVADRAAEVVAGLLHKYHGRALIVTTGACAVHCRYCFRRHYPYVELPRSLAEWEPAIAELATDTTIHEVLLSGGDPWTLTDAHLAGLAERLAGIKHLRRLRIHTRLPIVVPERVCDELLQWLRGTRLVPIVVVHANHAAEIDENVAAALARLVDAGVPVLNQTVLLRGVNDRVDTLVELCERLVDIRVMPYYLHQLDRVAGAAHFDVPVEVGRDLVTRLRERLPGYAVPRYVQEIPGNSGKTVLA